MVKTYSRKVYAAAFAAMMVATGVSAFADANQVELSNGTTITWDQFVSGVNDPNSVVADINTDEDPAVIAAKQLVETKKGDVTTAETTLKEKEALVAEDSELIKTQTAAATALTDAQTALTNAQDSLTRANNALTRLTTRQGNLASRARLIKDGNYISVLAPFSVNYIENNTGARDISDKVKLNDDDNPVIVFHHFKKD